MSARLLIYRPLFARVFFIQLLVLASIALSQNAALGQQRVLAPQPPQQSHTLNLRFPGEQPRPLAMVSGDFDEDGVTDLVIGYGAEKGGSITLLRGNLDAIAPQTQASWLAAGRHQYSDPFLQLSKPVSTTTQPDLMISADVNGDGHLDLVYATKGAGQLNVMFGDGRGNFLPRTASITIPGSITALAAYRPGVPVPGEAVLVGYESSRGGRLGILSLGAAGLSMKATYTLPAAPSMFAVDNLDADFIPDAALVAGGELLVLHGKNAISGGGRLEVLPVDGVESVTSGEFLFDRHAQLQLSLVTSNGEVSILAHQGFDPRPYTPEQIATARHEQMLHPGSPSLAQLAGNTGNQPWTVVESHPGAAPHGSGLDVPILLRSRMSGSGADDLVVLNPSQQQQMVIGHRIGTPPASASRLTPSAPSRIAVSNLASGNVVGALSMRVSADGRSGLVILREGDPSPEITLPSAGNTFYVNTTADNTGTTTDPPDSTRCTMGGAELCTLRDAITYVNLDAANNIPGNSDTIMVPAGTYQLTWQAGTFDPNGNALTHLEVLGPVTIVGSTSGSGVIINGDNNDTIFTINPGPYGSFNPSGNSYVFDMTIENVTMENAKNNNNINTSTSGLTNNVGGGLNWDAFGTGNLTLTNSTVQNCTIQWGAGGGIWAENSAGGGTGELTLTGGSVSNNGTPEQGGGVYIAFPPVAMSASNTTISNNIAELSINSDDPGADGTAGGLFLTARTGSPATPQTTLTGVTISGNTATIDGGGIYTAAGILLSTSLVSGNSAGRWGGGLFAEEADPEIETTVASTNFLNNSAKTTGGGLAVGPDNPSSGYSLQVTLSRIFGNTSTGGTNGLGLISPGKAMATNNWWGCNAGPGNASCDRADGAATTSPWATFGFSATPPTTIALGSSIGLNLTLNTNSASQSIPGAFPAVSNPNYTYSFSVSGVTATLLSPGTFSSAGTGTATLTPTSSGSGTVSAKFDNQTDSVNFVVTTATSLAISPASPVFQYGQPSSLTVQLTPGNATGIIASDFTVTVDGSSTGFSLSLISNNNYQISGPFNGLPPGLHTLAVHFLGTTDYSASNASTPLTVLSGSVTIGDTITPPKPVQGQGGTVQVTVTQVGSGAAPTGSVGYSFDGGTTTNVNLVGGVANITIPTIIQTGNHSLLLVYSGDTNYASATTTVPLTIYGRSQTTIVSLTDTTATINVFGFGFTPPSGTLSFTDVTTMTPVTGPVTLNTATATTTLLPPMVTSTGANTLPVWTTLADVNGDGILDLITSLYATDSVTVQLGNGDGTFRSPATVFSISGFGPAEVHAASLRGNGTLDLIIGSFNLNEIAVLLGNGDGTFATTPTTYTIGSAVNTPTSLTTGDFNNNGKLDVAVANTGDNTISILIGDGTGHLVPEAPINVGRLPQAIRAGDFNGDGYSDLAVANYADGTVTTLVNNQNGTFAANTVSIGSGAGSGPQALAINGSGSSLHLAVANYKDNTVSVLHSNGDGTFGAQKIVNVGKGPDDVNFADFNGDGIPDLAVSNYTDGTVDLLLGQGSGNYTLLGPFLVGNNPYSAAVGDLDLDGTPDIAVSNCFSHNTGVLLSGTQISTQYSGLSLTPGDVVHGTYNPDGASKYGPSTSPNVTVPGVINASTTMSLNGTSFDFGDNIVGHSLAQTVVKVTNTGTNPLTLAPALSGDASFSLVAGQSCGTQLLPGKSCNEVVSYMPTTASAPSQQTTTLNLNPGNVPAGTPSTVLISGTSGMLIEGTVTATINPQVALYSITLPFPATVKVNFGKDTTYGLSTWTQSTPVDNSATNIYVAGMLQNTTYQMQASITFANGVTVTDSNHAFKTTSYTGNVVPTITASTTTGQTPQPGIEMLNPCCGAPSLQLLATDLAGQMIWAYLPPDMLTGGAGVFAPKQLPNGDVLLIISPTSSAPLHGGVTPGAPILAREIDLAGNTVKQITLAQLNTRLASASCAECSNLTLLTFHHDITPLPNGHWLILSNILKEVTLTGQTTPTNVLGDVIVDVDQNLNPVWVWNEFNHLDVNRHPYLFPDWTHTNAIVYSPDDGNFLVSMRHQNWIVKVNYQNGAGDGSIVWHLGEGGDFALQNGTTPTDWFYAQHAPSFTTSNTTGTFGLTVMDNGDDRMFPSGVHCGTTGEPPCLYSTVPVFRLDETAKTATLEFHWIVPANLYNLFGGNAEQLANGDLEFDLCGLFAPSDHSEVNEITQGSTPEPVWQMTITGTFFYRAFRQPSLYPGVQWNLPSF